MFSFDASAGFNLGTDLVDRNKPKVDVTSEAAAVALPSDDDEFGDENVGAEVPQAQEVSAAQEDEKKHHNEMWVCTKCHSLASVLMKKCGTCGSPQAATAASTGSSLDAAYVGLPTELADKATRARGRGAVLATSTPVDIQPPPGGRGAPIDIQPPPGGRGGPVDIQPPSAGRGRGAPPAAPGRGGIAGRGGVVPRAAPGANIEWVNPSLAGKEPTTKEGELKALKDRLHLAEAKRACVPGTKRVDPEDGTYYECTEYMRYSTGTEGIQKWADLPTLGKWGIWGYPCPKGAAEEDYIEESLKEANAQVKIFTEKKEKWQESLKKREIDAEDLIKLREEKQAMEAEIARLKALKS